MWPAISGVMDGWPGRVTVYNIYVHFDASTTHWQLPSEIFHRVNSSLEAARQSTCPRLTLCARHDDLWSLSLPSFDPSIIKNARLCCRDPPCAPRRVSRNLVKTEQPHENHTWKSLQKDIESRSRLSEMTRSEAMLAVCSNKVSVL